MKKEKKQLAFLDSSFQQQNIYVLDATSWKPKDIIGKKDFEILVPLGRVSFHQNPLIFHATKLPCYKPTDWGNIFLSVEAMQRRKGKTGKRKQSFTVFFIVPFTLTYYFFVDLDKGELTHVIASPSHIATCSNEVSKGI